MCWCFSTLVASFHNWATIFHSISTAYMIWRGQGPTDRWLPHLKCKTSKAHGSTFLEPGIELE
ncbi:hypothetical protein M758_4G226200 [Ceratodon purpureus]|nr:hypothetical protein M758_4G226200 [Ceratodon purpureus]